MSSDIISIDIELRAGTNLSEDSEKSPEESTIEESSPEEISQEEHTDIEDAISQGHGEFEDSLDEAIERAVEDAVEKILPKESSKGPDGYMEFAQFVGDLNTQGIRNLRSAAVNPAQFAQGGLMQLLQQSSKGIAIAAIITAIIQAPEMVEAITKALAQKGSIWNQDYHRRFLEELQTGIDRDLQYRRAIGLDVVITSDNPGYLLKDPAFITNSLVGIDDTGILRLTDKDTQYGYVTGL